MGLVIDIADAVEVELNAAAPGSFSQSFTAKRSVLPVFDLEDLAELKVTVVPKAVDITGSTRSTSQYDITIDIGVQKKLPPGNIDLNTEVAVLGTFVDEIMDYLRKRTLTQLPGAVWIAISNDPVYAPQHLAEQRTFTSVLTVTYRAIK